MLTQVEHPAVEPLLEYKELARLYVAHGWSWLDSWVHNGRFRPEYVVGGVVSGRWATRGGAALQLPKVLRTAVRADPGWTFVAADAAQLEPRVLAALSEDDRLAEVSGDHDLYASLAKDSFAGDRGKAKIAMLSAMYGGTSGEAGPLLAILRRRFPKAVGYVEDAARAGEAGHLVRSRLGRTSPPPSAARQELLAGTGDERRSRQAAREWGRFTRNFVVQASAADWTAALLAGLRTGLAVPGTRPRNWCSSNTTRYWCTAGRPTRTRWSTRSPRPRTPRAPWYSVPPRCAFRWPPRSSTATRTRNERPQSRCRASGVRSRTDRWPASPRVRSVSASRLRSTCRTPSSPPSPSP